MNERVKQLREVLKMTQEQFAERIGLTRNYISLVESGSRTFADRTLKDICREFGVNETWLKTGDGEMLSDISPENRLMIWAGRVLADSSDSFRYRFVRMMMGMTDSEWGLLERKARELLQDEKTGDS